MSDFLTNLTARSAVDVPLVLPRPQARFEPPAGPEQSEQRDAEAPDELDLEQPVPAARRPRTLPPALPPPAQHASPAGQPAPLPCGPLSDSPPPPPAAAPARGPSIDSPPPSPATAPARGPSIDSLPPLLVAAPARGPAGQTSRSGRAPQSEAAALALPTGATPPARPPAEPPRAASQTSLRSIGQLPGPQLAPRDGGVRPALEQADNSPEAPRRPGAHRPGTPPEPTPSAARPPQAADPLPSLRPDLPPTLPEPAPRPAPAPVVQITIGRVEVRAAAPAGRPEPRTERRQSVSTLDEYLRQRGGGR